ncbi:MAG: hypothetical protein M0R22_07425 [Dehalococcoidia bacterium]|nr:hypothetical protein [Dehalococcoidia bacterium]
MGGFFAVCLFPVSNYVKCDSVLPRARMGRIIMAPKDATTTLNFAIVIA